MNQDTEQKILDVLREIREGQREALTAMKEYRSLVKEQIRLKRSRNLRPLSSEALPLNFVVRPQLSVLD